MHLRVVIAKNVKAIRASRSMKQEELAHIADLHPTYLSGIENARKNLTVDLLERIATALGVSAEDLVHRDPL